MDGTTPPGMTWADRGWWRLRRAGWRHSGLIGVVCLLVTLVTDPSGVLILAAAALLSAAFLAWEWWRGHTHYKEHVLPLYHRLKAAGVPFDGPPVKHLHVPLHRQQILVHLPHHWHAPQQVLEVAGKLAAATADLPGGHEVTPQLAGRKRHLKVAPPELWPGNVGLAAIMPAIQAAGQWHIVAGLGRDGKPRGFSIAGDGALPHGLINGPTVSAGKSTVARCVCSQWCRHGGVVVICDVAGLSHPWAHTFRDGGAPNVVVLRSVEEIAAAILWISDKADDRRSVAVVAQRRSGVIEADLGVKVLLLIEELVALMQSLKDYPEVLDALLKLVVMGRHPGIHLAFLAQRSEARTLAGKHGGTIRENLGWGFFGVGTTPATLKFTAEGLPYPKGGVHGPPGRAGLIAARTWTDVQVANLSNEEAFQLATSGTVAALPAGFPMPGLPPMPGVPDLVPDNRGCALPAGESLPPGAGTPAAGTPPPLVKLSDVAADDKHLARLRKRRSRARRSGQWVPEVAAYDGTTELFVASEMDSWMESA
jgi:hypothetical protein